MAVSANTFYAYLAQRLEAEGSETIIYLDRITTVTGETIVTADFATFGRGVISLNPDGTVSNPPEWASFTGVDGTALSLTGVTRGLSAKGNSVVATNKLFHAVGTPVAITFGVHNIQDIIDYVDALFVRESILVQIYDGTTDVAVGDGKAYITIPESLNGMNLVRAQATVVTAGTTNATTVMIHNKTDARDMLSGAISIASAETVGTAGTVNATYDDVQTNDILRVDVDSVSTTAPKGMMVVLEFSLP